MHRDLYDDILARTRATRLLSPAEEAALLAACAAGDPAAETQLLVRHLPLVVKGARRYARFGAPVTDLVQEGMVGLLRAVRRFRPEAGARLGTWAAWQIRRSLQEHVVQHWSLVRVSTTGAQKALFFRLARLGTDLRHGAEEFGQRTDDWLQAVARQVGGTVQDVAQMMGRLTQRDEALPPDALAPLASPDPDPEAALLARVTARALRTWLEAGLARLPPREALIVRRRHLEEPRATHADLGLRLGLSRHRVRQLEQSALRRLRSLLPAEAAEAL